MPNRPLVLPEDLEHLLDFIQKGKLFALADWLKAGKPLRAPDDAERGPNVLRSAVTTGFHSIVEEHHAALGNLQPSLLQYGRSGKRPALMPKQIALQQRLGNCRAVDRNERRRE